jgi:tRNA 2-thiocytidine biosynthesis protein TtcA
MLREWDRNFPGRIDNLHRAFSQVVPSHLMDRKLFPFETIRPSGIPDAAGDKAFDEDDGDDEGCGTSASSASTALPAVATVALPVSKSRPA